ncbi:MAG: N-acetyltransferase [Pseudomonadales bacterium]|nr:N-acetyltransferase [Pseudomonadales bacterium]
MILKALEQEDSEATSELFFTVFSKSEGEDEGRLISSLASELASNIDNIDIHGFAAVDESTIVAAIFFSRLSFDVALEAYVPSPVAVRTASQGSGIGQALIRFGISEMANRHAQYITTYGDPSFYSKVGFRPVSTEEVPPPFDLSQPEGWLGQSVGDQRSIIVEGGRAKCVAALNDQAYW